MYFRVAASLASSFFIYLVGFPKGTKDPFDSVIEGKDDGPVQAATSWFF